MTESAPINPLDLPFRFGDGPAEALLIHGFLGTPGEMRPLGEALAAIGFTSHGVALPGFGPDIKQLPRMTAEDWIGAARTAWQATRRPGARRLLIGYSMGGAIALALAAEDPPDRLVLIAPHWRYADRRAVILPVAHRVMKTFRPFAHADFGDPAVRAMFADIAPGVDLDDPAVQHRLRRETTIRTRTLNEVRRVGRIAIRTAWHCRNRFPIVIVQGVEDQTTLPANSRELARRLGARTSLVEIPGGHVTIQPGRAGWPELQREVLEFAQPLIALEPVAPESRGIIR